MEMRLRGLWRDADFLKLWGGQSVSQLGSWVTLVGLPLTAVLVLQASPMQMGILSGAGGAAILLVGLFAGAWVDRLRRRPIMIWADLGRAAILATIPGAAALHRLTMSHLYLAATVSAILTVLFDVSYEAYLPSLVNVGSILEGNSKMALSRSIAEVAGPGVAGALVEWLTAPIAILFDAVSFVCSAVSLGLIHKPEVRPAPHPAPHIGREIVEGLQAAWRTPALRAILLRKGAASFCLGFPSALYFLFALRELKLSAVLLSAVIAVGGASSLFGALIAERVVRRLGCGPALIGAAMLCGGASLLVPLARGPVVVCAAILALAQLGDLSWPIYHVAELSLRQSLLPNRLLGRVNSAMHVMFGGVLPLGALAGGALAETIGLRATLLAGAAGFLLSNLWLVLSPVRDLRELPSPVTVG